VEDRSRGRFATPADFPLHDCSPYSHVHVRRESLGFVHHSRTILCRAVPNPNDRNFFTRGDAPRPCFSRCVLLSRLPLSRTPASLRGDACLARAPRLYQGERFPPNDAAEQGLFYYHPGLPQSIPSGKFGKAARFEVVSVEDTPTTHVLRGSSTQRSLARQPGPGSYGVARFGMQRPTVNKLAQRGSDFGFGSRARKPGWAWTSHAMLPCATKQQEAALRSSMDSRGLAASHSSTPYDSRVAHLSTRRSTQGVRSP
jgi:hypothetical protein